MRATTIHAPRDIRLSDVPEPAISRPTDAIVAVVAGSICGSDLWPYRGANPISPGATIGHEAVGTVAEVGAEVNSFRPGDFVVVPFDHCDNTCPHCRAGMHAACENIGFTASGQAEYTLVNQADGSLVKADGQPDADLIPSLLTLAYLPHLLQLVLDRTINPGLVFDRTLPLDRVAEGYRLMDQREAIKVLLQP